LKRESSSGMAEPPPVGRMMPILAFWARRPVMSLPPSKPWKRGAEPMKQGRTP